MRHPILAVSAAATLLAASFVSDSPAADDASVTIGVAAPLSGSSALLGEQVKAGAQEAAAALGADGPVELRPVDTACTPEGGTAAAQALVAAQVDAVIGFLCTESIETALPLLAQADIPTIDVGVRANRLTDKRAKTGNRIWRVAPRSDAEADAIAKLLIQRWRDVPYGLVDDGTIYGRGLADAVRTRMEAAGLRASTVDNYRPAEEKQFGLARRIQKTGVTNIFIAGDRQDVAVIARDAAELELKLEIYGGESLFDENSIDLPLPTGIHAVAPFWDAAATPSGSATDAAASSLPGYALPAAAAVEIAVAAVRRSRQDEEPVAAVLDAQTFSTRLGEVRFDAVGDADLDVYRDYVWRGDHFAPAAEQP
ncbi:ABC transporter substrate-binding protein [Aurantimonas sp. MSK8Z-1]|uniref:ABC transporter substrate-binding protein n=1 Tax=Mangrovibrevibacter kandeliae TaxID=2968473 RepID=UPI002118985A|nr:ABC transporter substrate-binding protein [Aurantimonas sp. MSK8Z-1]MCW4114447.1 ABC transporter substrate-binding protein [Aurantimonas sp. MSK8Z-1]